MRVFYCAFCSRCNSLLLFISILLSLSLDLAQAILSHWYCIYSARDFDIGATLSVPYIFRFRSMQPPFHSTYRDFHIHMPKQPNDIQMQQNCTMQWLHCSNYISHWILWRQKGRKRGKKLNPSNRFTICCVQNFTCSQLFFFSFSIRNSFSVFHCKLRLQLQQSHISLFSHKHPNQVWPMNCIKNLFPFIYLIFELHTLVHTTHSLFSISVSLYSIASTFTRIFHQLTSISLHFKRVVSALRFSSSHYATANKLCSILLREFLLMSIDVFIFFFLFSHQNEIPPFCHSVQDIYGIALHHQPILSSFALRSFLQS